MRKKKKKVDGYKMTLFSYISTANKIYIKVEKNKNKIKSDGNEKESDSYTNVLHNLRGAINEK